MFAQASLARFALALGVVLLGVDGASGAGTVQNKNECQVGRGSVARTIGTVRVRITPTVDKDLQNEPICHVEVRDLRGSVLFSDDDYSFKVLLDDKDVSGDGIPDLVLESYSGGAHCCWTYYVLSLTTKPKLLTKFANERDASFEVDQTSGATDIVTLDGAFDYFDGLCHACTVFPLVYLRLSGTELLDAGPQHLANYDEIIRKNRAALTPSELRMLQTTKETPCSGLLAEGTAQKALAIIFAYLYSGRTDQARAEFQRMWPPFDQGRMWKLIQDTRSGGILSYTHSKTRLLPLV